MKTSKLPQINKGIVWICNGRVSHFSSCVTPNKTNTTTKLIIIWKDVLFKNNDEFTNYERCLRRLFFTLFIRFDQNSRLV